jgi:hypothetical protein
MLKAQFNFQNELKNIKYKMLIHLLKYSIYLFLDYSKSSMNINMHLFTVNFFRLYFKAY